MDPRRLRDIERWLNQYAARTSELTARSELAVAAPYRRVSDWYSPDQTIAAALAAATAAATTRQLMAGLAGQFMAAVLFVLTGTRIRDSIRTPGRVREADPFAVYSRPIWTYRDTIALGGTDEQARIAATVRAEILAQMEGILARAAAEAEQIDRAGVTHYRRVIRPELSGGNTCDLCAAAATRLYRVGDLQPIHDRCRCTTLPVIGDQDPGRTLNATDLPAPPSPSAVKVEQHSELGPILVDPTTPKSTARRRAAEAGARAGRMEEVLATLRARAAAGEPLSTQIAYSEERIEQLRTLAQAA